MGRDDRHCCCSTLSGAAVLLGEIGECCFDVAQQGLNEWSLPEEVRMMSKFLERGAMASIECCAGVQFVSKNDDQKNAGWKIIFCAPLEGMNTSFRRNEL